MSEILSNELFRLTVDDGIARVTRSAAPPPPPSEMAASYERGLVQVGEGVLAYLQPDGGWGFSNAGLVSDGLAVQTSPDTFALPG